VGVTQQQVQDALAKVASPRGVALTNAGVLSAISVSDGKVFFSINVEATEARAWESVRAAAEAAVRDIPGVDEFVDQGFRNFYLGQGARMSRRRR
jgi:ATP-binding protein involved in chromosome partitioning